MKFFSVNFHFVNKIPIFIQEEEYKRLSEALAEDGSYNAVGFTYGSDYYDPSEPTEEEEPSKQRGEREAGLALRGPSVCGGDVLTEPVSGTESGHRHGTGELGGFPAQDKTQLRTIRTRLARGGGKWTPASTPRIRSRPLPFSEVQGTGNHLSSLFLK